MAEKCCVNVFSRCAALVRSASLVLKEFSKLTKQDPRFQWVPNVERTVGDFLVNQTKASNQQETPVSASTDPQPEVNVKQNYIQTEREDSARGAATSQDEESMRCVPNGEPPIKETVHTSRRAPPITPRRQQNEMNDSKIPSTQLSRVFGFGTLAARLALGTITSGSAKSEQNVEVLASTLCRMRGAALKLGHIAHTRRKYFPKGIYTSA